MLRHRAPGAFPPHRVSPRTLPLPQNCSKQSRFSIIYWERRATDWEQRIRVVLTPAVRAEQTIFLFGSRNLRNKAKVSVQTKTQAFYPAAAPLFQPLSRSTPKQRSREGGSSRSHRSVCAINFVTEMRGRLRRCSAPRGPAAVLSAARHVQDNLKLALFTGGTRHPAIPKCCRQ